jgi:hypothetical protein
MLIKINRQTCLEKYPKFPLRWYNESTEEIDHTYPQVVSSFILTLPSKTFKGHSKLIGIELTELIVALGADSLIFLGDFTTAWLHQESDYPPVQEALLFLKEHNVGKKFNGALQVDKESLPVFIKHLSWLSRCNAALPYFYFTDPTQNILGLICQYGNLHINAVTKETATLLKDRIEKSKFSYSSDGKCYERFSQSGAIKERQIKL